MVNINSAVNKQEIKYPKCEKDRTRQDFSIRIFVLFSALTGPLMGPLMGPLTGSLMDPLMVPQEEMGGGLQGSFAFPQLLRIVLQFIIIINLLQFIIGSIFKFNSELNLKG
jgi:hypothetical protein